MASMELTTGILLDQENKMLVVYREDHHQWELPGSKLIMPTPEEVEILANEEDLAPHSLCCAFRSKLGLDVAPTDLVELGGTEFEQAGVQYPTRWFQVMRVAGILSVDTSIYDKHMFVPPLSLNFLRKSLSPNIRDFQRELNYGRIQLHLNP